MQELVRLRQQQQGTDNQLQTMTQRLKGMEQRQQQVMSFLAKALQSPGFFAQFVQQQAESKRITESNKKRRIKPEHISKNGSSSSDGQIVKYQSYGNDETKAMFRQLWGIDDPSHSSSMSFSENLESFPVDGVPQSDVACNRGSSSPVSGAVFHNSAANSENPTISEALGCNTLTGTMEDIPTPDGSGSSVTLYQKSQNIDALVDTHEQTSHLLSDLVMDEFSIYPDMPPEDIVDVTNDKMLGPTSFETEGHLQSDLVMDEFSIYPDMPPEDIVDVTNDKMLGPTSFETEGPFSLDIDSIPFGADIDSFFNEDDELWDILNEKSEGMQPL